MKVLFLNNIKIIYNIIYYNNSTRFTNYMVFLGCFFFHLSISILTELLEKSLALLNKSHELTEFIEEFKREGPNANTEVIQGAQSSCLKIDSLLELLQDRRRQLDRSLKHQRQGLEQVLQICLWHQQENQVRCIIVREVTVTVK